MTWNEFKEQLLTDTVVRQSFDATNAVQGLGFALAEVRRQQGLRQEDLASRIGLTQAEISRVESGNGNPTWSTVAALLVGLGARAEFRFTPPDGGTAPRIIVGALHQPKRPKKRRVGHKQSEPRHRLALPPSNDDLQPDSRQ